MTWHQLLVVEVLPHLWLLVLAMLLPAWLLRRALVAASPALAPFAELVVLVAASMGAWISWDASARLPSSEGPVAAVAGFLSFALAWALLVAAGWARGLWRRRAATRARGPTRRA